MTRKPAPKLAVPKELVSARRLPEPPALIHTVSHVPKRMIVDTDNHFEIADERWQSAKLQFAYDKRVDGWFNLGDNYDFHFLSRYEKDPYRGLITIQKEFDSAQWYWQAVSKLVDRGHYILGNHEKRLHSLIEANPGLFGLRVFDDFHTLASLPSNIKVYPYGSHVKVGNVWGEHGDHIKSEANPCKWALDKRQGLIRAFGHYHQARSLSLTTLNDEGQEIERSAYNVGHGTIKKYHRYAGTIPSWQMGFLFVEHYTVAGRLHAQVHHIKGNQSTFAWEGKIYGRGGSYNRRSIAARRSTRGSAATGRVA